MKKLAVIALVALLSVSSVFASSSLYKGASKKGSVSVGLNAGTNTGVVVNYGTGNFDIEGIVGFGVLNGSGLDVEAAASYSIVDVAEECKFDGSMPFTVGLGADLAFRFSDPLQMYVGVLVPLKLTYTFPKFPASLYIRVAPGVNIQVVDTLNASFGISGSIGATYNF